MCTYICIYRERGRDIVQQGVAYRDRSRLGHHQLAPVARNDVVEKGPKSGTNGTQNSRKGPKIAENGPKTGRTGRA